MLPSLVQGRMVSPKRIVARLLLLLSCVLACLIVGTAVAPASARAASKKVQLQELTMLDQQTGWALTQDRTSVLFTRHGFSNWRDVTPPRLALSSQDGMNMITASAFPDASHGYLGVLQNGLTRLYMTSDSGKTWKSTSFDFSPLTMIGIYQIQFIDPLHGWLAFDKAHGFGKYHVVLMSTSDGGANWQQLLDTTQSDASGLPVNDFKRFQFTSPQIGWMTGPENQIPGIRLYMTRDGGKTWTRSPLPVPPNSTFTESSGPYFQNSRSATLPVMVGLEDGSPPYLQVYQTHDGGATWRPGSQLVTSSYTELRGLAFHNARDGWTLGLDGNQQPIIHQTRNGGQQWKTFHPAGLQSMTEVVMDLDFLTPWLGWTINKADDGTLTLFQTHDGGRSWQVVQPLIA